MINNKLLTFLKRLGYTIIGLVVFIFGYMIGDSLRASSVKVIEQSVNETTKGDIQNKQHYLLEQQYIIDFLIAFYTKKELEENRERYRPFMTEGLYQATIAEENKPIQQAYKGYIIDQVYEQSTIYINQEKKEVIAQVIYRQTILASKQDTSRSTTHTVTETLKLGYVLNNGQLIMNKLDKMTLEKPEQSSVKQSTIKTEKNEMERNNDTSK